MTVAGATRADDKYHHPFIISKICSQRTNISVTDTIATSMQSPLIHHWGTLTDQSLLYNIIANLAHIFACIWNKCR